MTPQRLAPHHYPFAQRTHASDCDTHASRAIRSLYFLKSMSWVLRFQFLLLVEHNMYILGVLVTQCLMSYVQHLRTACYWPNSSGEHIRTKRLQLQDSVHPSHLCCFHAYAFHVLVMKRTSILGLAISLLAQD